MKIYSVYVLKSQSTGKIYVGQTADIARRLKRHNKELPVKKTGYTAKNSGPWEIIYTEKFLTRKEALQKEKQLKTHQGRDFIKRKFLGP